MTESICGQSLHITPFTFFLWQRSPRPAGVADQEQVLIGVPSLNRGGRRYKDTMGINSSACWVQGILRCAPDMSAAELVTRQVPPLCAARAAPFVIR
jgi:hypothetical protein